MTMKEIYESKKELLKKDIAATISEITEYINSLPTESFLHDLSLTTKFYNKGCKFGIYVNGSTSEMINIKVLDSCGAAYCEKVIEKALTEIFTDDPQAKLTRHSVTIKSLEF